MSDDGSIIAVKKKDGGYIYYLHTATKCNGVPLKDEPDIRLRISEINLEIFDALRDAANSK